MDILRGFFSVFFFLSGEQCERARRLQAKMMTNLVMAKDRLQLLGISELYNWNEMYLKCVFNELLM